MDGDERRGHPLAPSRSARISVAICLTAGAVMLAMGGIRMARDGSFWLDEASIAVNLLTQGPCDLFGPYATGHSFPRLYLVPISLLQAGFGYSTALLRTLPFLAFVAGVVLWLRVAYTRFQKQPLLLALLVVLCLVPVTWFAYAAMLKQYTLDVALALVPFVLSDRFFDERLREGRGRAALVALVAPCLLSFTYPIPLLARVLGYAGFGCARGQRYFHRAAMATFCGALAAALLAMWLVDMRHTAGSESLFRFWSKCIPAADWSRTPALVLDLHTGWYRHLPFGPAGGVSSFGIALLGAGWLLGALSIAHGAFAVRDGQDAAHAEWGSRGLSSLLVVLGLVAASLVVRYPLCPGRLTLFALFAIQLVTVEGFAAAARRLERAGGRVAAAALVGIALGLCLPSAARTARFVWLRDPPENVRPLLHHLDEAPALPILVAACSTRQISTLPELFDDPRVRYYDERVGRGERGWPDAEEFWVISAGSRFYCPWFYKSMTVWADEVTPYSNGRLHTASMWRVHMRVPDETPDR